MLIHMYSVHAWNQDFKTDNEAPHSNGFTNGHMNGYARHDSRIRDADEYELNGLDSDDDEDTLDGKESKPLVGQH
jgi:hypothetical protein